MLGPRGQSAAGPHEGFCKISPYWPPAILDQPNTMGKTTMKANLPQLHCRSVMKLSYPSIESCRTLLVRNGSTVDNTTKSTHSQEKWMLQVVSSAQVHHN